MYRFTKLAPDAEAYCKINPANEVGTSPWLKDVAQDEWAQKQTLKILNLARDDQAIDFVKGKGKGKGKDYIAGKAGKKNKGVISSIGSATKEEKMKGGKGRGQKGKLGSRGSGSQGSGKGTKNSKRQVRFVFFRFAQCPVPVRRFRFVVQIRFRFVGSVCRSGSGPPPGKQYKNLSLIHI